ncbi:MAG: hypothetical protein V9E90_15195 [Saprospiraceae bacterium]|jgi:hypothetical protein
MKTQITKIAMMLGIFMINFGMHAHAAILPLNGPEILKGAELTFAENKCQIKDFSGKLNKKVLFLAQADNMKYLFRKDGISMQLAKPAQTMEVLSDDKVISIQSPAVYQKLEISFEGMNRDADLYGAEEFRTVTFKNDISNCQTRNFRKLYYTEMYPGIDLRYSDFDARLKYEFIVQPGFNYQEIRMKIDSAKEISINNLGQLVINTATGDLVEDAPIAIQEGKPLLVKWVVDQQTVSFRVLNPDSSKELYIQSSFQFNRSLEPKI